MGKDDVREKLHANHRERIRERFEREGALSLEPHVLLELYLYDVLPRIDTNPIAHRLLSRFRSLDGVFSAPYEELIKVKGVGPATASYIKNTFSRMSDAVVDSFRASPVGSFEKAAGILVWTFRKDPSAELVVVNLNEDCLILRIDRYRCGKVPDDIEEQICGLAVSANAKYVIIGVRKGARIPDVEKIPDDVTVHDVIEVSGFDAKSLMP